ncbi:hypothetical protein MBAV_001728, partial [Candidatus Magnetobacterium bavaricum]
MPTIATREAFEDMTNRFESSLPPNKRPKRPTYEEYLNEMGVPQEDRTGMLETIGRSIPAGIASGIKRVGETAETGISELQKLTPDFVDTLLNAPKF